MAPDNLRYSQECIKVAAGFLGCFTIAYIIYCSQNLSLKFYVAAFIYLLLLLTILSKTITNIVYFGLDDVMV